jgi:hypothetical protein
MNLSVPDDFTGMIHLSGGQFHRDDGPAIEWADGTKE